MGVGVVVCPVCRQRLGLLPYVQQGDELVCADKGCGATLRVESLRPPRVALVPPAETLNANSRPESYG